MDSFHDEANNEHPKTPLENLKDILAKTDAQAAAVLPPGTKAVFSVEGEGAEAQEEEKDIEAGAGDFRKVNEAKSPAPSVSKSRLRSVLAAVEEFPQDKFSRQKIMDALSDKNLSFPNAFPSCRGLPLVVVGNPEETIPGPPTEAFGGDSCVFSESIRKLDELIKAFKYNRP